MDYIELGSVPSDEDCVQVSTKEDYLDEMKKECLRYKDILIKRFPGSTFILKRFNHDFGSYYEVCHPYNDNSETESDKAFWIEDNLPAHWNDTEILTYKAPGGCL